MKPITPAEAFESKLKEIPDFVIGAFNTIITRNLDSSGRAHVKQDDVINVILSTPAAVDAKVTKQQIFDNGWLDVEPLYQKAGWKVRYEKPCYGDADFDAFFEFVSPKKQKL